MNITNRLSRFGSITGGTALVIALSVSQAVAATTDFSGFKIGNPTVGASGTDAKAVISDIASRVIGIILVVAAVLAVLFLMYSGIVYITSAGNAERAKAARAGIINAIIGIIIILGAFFIVRFAASLGTTVDGADKPGTGSVNTNF